MSTSKVEIEVPRAVHVSVGEDTLVVELSDGRTISVPLAWYPRLLHASNEERRSWRLVGRGRGVHWDVLDEDVSVEDVMAGRASAESRASLQTWLDGRRPVS